MFAFYTNFVRSNGLLYYTIFTPILIFDPTPVQPSPVSPTTRLPGDKTTTLYTCSRRPIILYLLWIEDDFGLRNHKNSHKMGEFSGYFLERLHQQLNNPNNEQFKNYTVEVRSVRKDLSTENKYGKCVIKIQ